MKKRLALLVLLSFLFMILINALANIIPIAGKTTGEISDSYPSLFTPAPITFSIWGVIYLLLLCYVIYQVQGLFKERKEGVSLLFILSCLVNSLWIIVWHYQYILLSLLVMFFLFFLLLKIYLYLRPLKGNLSKREWLFLQLPFSIYFGWITVATIANITAFLVSIDWNGWGLTPSFWSGLVILAATFITILMLYRERDFPYALVVIWAFLGIILERTSSSPLYVGVVFVAVCGILLILGFGYLSLKRYQEPS